MTRTLYSINSKIPGVGKQEKPLAAWIWGCGRLGYTWQLFIPSSLYHRPALRLWKQCLLLPLTLGLTWRLSDKESTDNAGDVGSIPGLGRSPGEGNGSPFQYSWPQNPLGRGAWRAGLLSVGLVRHDSLTKQQPVIDVGSRNVAYHGECSCVLVQARKVLVHVDSVFGESQPTSVYVGKLTKFSGGHSVLLWQWLTDTKECWFLFKVFFGHWFGSLNLPRRIKKLFYLIVPILMPFLCSFRIASSVKRNGNNSELEEGYWLTLAICANLCVLGGYSRKR